MKARRILIIFAAVIIALATLCAVFPREGITIGSLNLRLPSLHSLTVKQPQDVADSMPKGTVAAAMTLEDSVAQYRLLVDSSAMRFWLPDPHYFDEFWQRAEKAQADKRTLRVLHYGDSQIEMDHITSRLRAYMQNTFGGSGPGMLPFQTITPTMTVRQSNRGELIHLASFGDSMATHSRNDYGPMMQSFRLQGGNATTTIKKGTNSHVDSLAQHFRNIALIANNKGGLQASLTNLNDKKNPLRTKDINKGIVAIDWALDTTTAAIRLDVDGNADLYAVLVDGAEGGIAVDNIPMRGCSGQQFTLVNSKMLSAAYATMDIGLIILQFGGNSVPYFKDREQISQYCHSIGKQIDHVHTCCPNAKVLFIGPSDMSKRINGEMQTYPLIPELIDSLAATATSHNAAYWSIYHAMGGKNSMVAWSRKGLAGKDYIHFSQHGADLMGDLLSEAFDNSHQLYTMEKRLKKQEPEPTVQKKTTKAKKGKKRRRGGRR